MKSAKKEPQHPSHSTPQQPTGWLGFLLLGVVLVVFSSCDDGENDPQNPVTEQDRVFAVEATYSNLAEIEMGQLAIDKATNESISEFVLMWLPTIPTPRINYLL